MKSPPADLLKTMEILNRDPKYKEVLEWLESVKIDVGRNTNLLKSTDDMLRSAGRYQQMDDILKYMGDPSLYRGR